MNLFNLPKSMPRDCWRAAVFCLLVAGIRVNRADPLDTWTPNRKHLTHVAFGNGRFVAVGPEGTMRTSTDGVHWTDSGSNTEMDLREVVYGNDQFVAVGLPSEFCGSLDVPCRNLIASKDGVTWAPVEIALPLPFLSLAYGNGQYVAGLPNGVAHSPDGIHWKSSLPSTVFTPDTGFSVGAYGGGQFVFYGDQGRIITSTNGISWVAENSGTMSNLVGIAYGNGRFVALSWDGKIYTSPDAIQWAQKWAANGTDLARVLRAITYGYDRFVAVGDGGMILSSPDGVTWTQRAGLPDSEHRGLWGFEQGSNLEDVVYGNGIFVAVGDYGAICTSNDGDYWAELFPPIPGPSVVQDVAYGEGIFIAVKGEGISETGAILSSDDGLNWFPLIEGAEMGGISVAFGNRRFTVAGYRRNWRGSFEGYGVSWDQGWIVGTSAIIFANGQFMAANLSTSADGRNWVSHPSGTTNAITAVAYGKGRYAAVGENTTVLTSTDGVRWIPGSSPPTSLPYTFTGISFGNDRFVAVDRSGKTAVSQDGVQWTLNGWTQNPPQSLNSIAFGGGYFVAVGIGSNSRYLGAIMTSTDGSVWVKRTAPIDDELRRVVFADGYFLTFDSQGYAMRSGDLWVPLTINLDPNPSIVELSAPRATSAMVTIETSADLLSWRSFTNVAIPRSGDGSLRFPAEGGHAFYRARPSTAGQGNVLKLER